MNFALIGNVRQYAQMKNLKFAANYRMKTGQSLVRSNGTLNFNFGAQERTSFVNQMLNAKQSSDAADKKRLAAIKRKLMSGKKLSNEEMGFLLKTDSKLYKKAQKVEEAREELKSALSRAKTKEEARKAVLHAKMKASAECMAELDAAKSGDGGGASMPSGGGYEASGDVGGNVAGVGGFSVGSTEGAAENISGAENNFSDQNNFSEPQSTDGSTNNPNSTNGVNGTSTEEKDTPDDILEKYIMIIRALEDEWRTFSKSKQYRDLPDGNDDRSIIDPHKSEVISKYRAAMTLSLANQ